MNLLYANDLSYGSKHSRLLGVDEAGRGALAGPVVVAAVQLDYRVPIAGLDDSKKLSPAKRERLFEQIINTARAYKIVEISSAYIDAHNILQATLEGMSQAVCAITGKTGFCLIDGNQSPAALPCKVQCVVHGDGLHACIAAASILAKVHRDRLMTAFHQDFPLYGFDKHKGYGTVRHFQAILANGPCELHRYSFYPVSQYR